MAEFPLVYLDTNFLVAAFELREGRPPEAKAFVDTLLGRPGMAATSELTLAELMAPAPDADVTAQRRSIYRELLIDGDFIDLLPVTREVLLATLDFRDAAATMGRRPRLPDAIHIVTATRIRCRFFASMDSRLGPLLAPMQMLAFDAPGLDLLRRALHA